MDETVWAILERISDTPGPLTYAVVALSACLEYVFPPFPGDTVTLFAGFLVGAKGWEMTGILVAVNGGSLAGALLDYWFGTWLGRPERRWRLTDSRLRRLGEAAERVAHGFRRHEVLYLTCNRFLPSLRALFFVAAGMGGVPLWKVVTFGFLSSLLWNVLILLVGRQVGYEKDTLLALLRGYSVVVWVLVVVALAVALFVWRRRRARRSTDAPS